MTRPENVTPLHSVVRAAELGTRRDLLVALSDRLWEALNDKRTQPRDLSPLTLRLKELEAEIADIDNRAKDETSRHADAPWDERDI
jgi:hypothetical protein